MPVRFQQVDDKVLRGGAPSNEDLAILHDVWGVERVISLDRKIGEMVDPACKQIGLEHVILHLGDGTHENVPILARHFIPKLDDKKTYIHCRHGKDRTGMACAMYRCLKGADLKDALTEACKFGMGKGLSPSVGKSYYDAVRKWAKKYGDRNNTDAVEISRDQLSADNQTPGSRHTVSEGLADQEGNDYLNRPASQRLYRCCVSNKVLAMKQYWFADRAEAEHYSEGGRVYSGTLSSDADIVKQPGKPTKALMQAALLKGVDVISFANKIFMVFNPNAIENIVEEDVNDTLDVGLHDNYTGVGSMVSPGSGGIMEHNTGGFAGPVSLPFQGINM